MAQTFLETDFLLRRATPTAPRVSAQAPARAAFVVRDPEPSRATVATRSQDVRTPDARTQTARAELARANIASRSERARTPDIDTGQTRTTERTKAGPLRIDSSGAESSPAPVRAVRDVPAPPAKVSTKANAGPFGEAGAGTNALSQDRAGVVAPVPAGAAGSPEAGMAGAVLASSDIAAITGPSEVGAGDGTEEDTDPAGLSADEPAISLMGFGVLPAPPPPQPMLQVGPGQGGQTSVAGDAVSGGQDAAGQASAVTGQVSSSTGQLQLPSGSVPSPRGEAPAAAGQNTLARPDISAAGTFDPALGGKSDAAVAVHEAFGSAEPVAAFAMPEGLSAVRENFDALVPGFSAAPAATAASGASVTAAPAPQAAAPAVPLGAVPMTIGLRSLQGSNHFEIRLDPGELGRIDVSLDIDKERGTVMAHLVVDRIETLALLQRDAGSLQQALSQAGLDAPEANISLSLRSDTQSGGQGTENQGSDGRRPDGRSGGPGLSHQPEGRAALEAIPVRTLRGLTGLDIRI
jgi:hypothetical protein